MGKPVKVLLGLVVTCFAVAYFAINPIAQRLLPWVAENKLASRITVDQVKFDPLRLTLTLSNLHLTRLDSTPLAEFEQLYVDLESGGLLHWVWHLKDIRLTAPRVNLDIAPDGKLNWADLIAKLNEDKTPDDGTIPRVLIDHVLIERGNVQYSQRNRPEPFKTVLQPLGLELDGLSTLPEDRGDYLLSARLPEQGGALQWKGDVSLNPIASKGLVNVKGVNLAKLMQVVPPASLPFKLTAGDVATSFSYDFAMVQVKSELLPQAKLGKITVELSNLASDLAPQSKVALDSATLTLPALSFSMQKGMQVRLQGLDVAAQKFSLTQNGGGLLKLDQASMKLPALDFSMQKDAQVQLQGLDVVAQKFSMAQGGALFKLDQASVKLPALDYSSQNGAQVQFKGLDVAAQKFALAKGSETLFKLNQANVKGIDFDLLANQVKIADIALNQGEFNATRAKNGDMDWQNVFKSADHSTAKAATDSSKPEPKSAFKFDVAKVQLQHWKAAFSDQTFVHPLHAEIKDINFSSSISNADGGVAVNQINTELASITLLSALDPKPALSLAKVSLKNGAVSLKQSSIKLPAIVLSNLQTQVIREANKPLNWQAMLEQSSPPAIVTKQETTPTQSSSWKVALDKLAMENGNIHIEDKSLPSAVVLDMQNAAMELRDVSLDMTKTFPVKAKFQLKQGGQFDTSGKLALSPLKGDLQVVLDALSLKPFSPYINQLAYLSLNDGKATIKGKLAVESDKSLKGQFTGGFSIDDLALNEYPSNALFLGWTAVSSNSLKVALNPNQLHMDELRIQQPTGKFIIYEDKTLNVKRILRADAAQASAPPLQPVDANAPEGFPIAIDRVSIQDANVEFADLSLRPQFGTHINTLTGVINGLSSSINTTAQVELDGKVDEYGSARIRGSVQPFRATDFTDLKLAFHNLEMNRLTPYSGKFAGRKIDSGKLSVDLEYKIKQRQLAGENKFIINKIKLGERVKSADALDLPLDLAIALLEDSDGLIDLDLPIAGSLDDPQFSYGKIIGKAIVNVLGKIVTAPFRALGKLLGMSSDKLEAVMFEPGKAVLAPPEQEKLKAVADGLSKRHALTLTITPAFDVALDRPALQELATRRDVANELGVKLNKGESPGPIDIGNPKVQLAVENLLKDRKGIGRNLKALDSLKGYFKKAKPEDVQNSSAMLEQLKSTANVTDADLFALAKERASAMQSYLSKSATVEPERISITEPVKQSGDGNAVKLKLSLGTAKVAATK